MKREVRTFVPQPRRRKYTLLRVPLRELVEAKRKRAWLEARKAA